MAASYACSISVSSEDSAAAFNPKPKNRKERVVSADGVTAIYASPLYLARLEASGGGPPQKRTTASPIEESQPIDNPPKRVKEDSTIEQIYPTETLRPPGMKQASYDDLLQLGKALINGFDTSAFPDYKVSQKLIRSTVKKNPRYI